MNFLNNKKILFSIEELFHLVPCPAATGLFAVCSNLIFVTRKALYNFQTLHFHLVQLGNNILTYLIQFESLNLLCTPSRSDCNFCKSVSISILTLGPKNPTLLLPGASVRLIWPPSAWRFRCDDTATEGQTHAIEERIQLWPTKSREPNILNSCTGFLGTLFIFNQGLR